MKIAVLEMKQIRGVTVALLMLGSENPNENCRGH